MRSTRRFFTFGALLAAVVLLAPATAFGQAENIYVTPTDPPSFDKLMVNWDVNASTAAEVDGWRVYYRKDMALGTAAANATGHMDVSGRATDEATLTGLEHSTEYFVSVAPMTDGVVGALVASTDDSATADVDEMSATTAAAPPPSPPSGVMAEGGDMTFMVSWNASFPGGSGLTIDHYRVQKREVSGNLFGDWVPDEDNDDNDKMGGLKVAGDMTMVTFEDLENGTTYQARVMAMNSAGVGGEWSIPDGHMPAVGPESATVGGDDDDDMTETPALPLVGILLLGAGLVAAGRRRLRQ